MLVVVEKADETASVKGREMVVDAMVVNETLLVSLMKLDGLRSVGLSGVQSEDQKEAVDAAGRLEEM
jgi:hypothetical protein